MHVGQIERETLAYLDKKWGSSGTVDLHTALSEITILTASRCLHGDDVREQLFEEVANLYHDLDQGVTPLSVFFPYAWTTAHAKRDRARKVRERDRERERGRGRGRGRERRAGFTDRFSNVMLSLGVVWLLLLLTHYLPPHCSAWSTSSPASSKPVAWRPLRRARPRTGPTSLMSL